MSEMSPPMPPPAALAYVVGIDSGMESCMMCCLTMEKRQVIKPSQFGNDAVGFEWLFAHLEPLKVASHQILVGLEATSRDARKSLSCAQIARVSCLPLASRADPCLRATTRAAREDRSAGCKDHCTGSSQRRCALWVCSQRTSGNLSRSDTIASAADGRGCPL